VPGDLTPITEVPMPEPDIRPIGLWIPDDTVRGDPDEKEETGLPPPIRVWILESDPRVARELLRPLAGLPDISVVASTDSVEEAIRWLDQDIPDVLVMRAHASSDEGFRRITRHWRERDLWIPILVVVTVLDIRIWMREHQDGVHGWICFGRVPDLLPCAIRALGGPGDQGYWLDPMIAAQIAGAMAELSEQNAEMRMRLAALDGPLASLTPTEKAVLRDLAGGLSNRLIAERRNTTIATVKGHVTSILHKLGVSSRHEARRLAISAGLLDP
jgi:DNA-binding NarL/FixJ family response regulator